MLVIIRRKKIAYAVAALLVAVLALVLVVASTRAKAEDAKDPGSTTTTVSATTASAVDSDVQAALAQMRTDIESSGVGVEKAEAKDGTIYLRLAVPGYSRTPESMLAGELQFLSVMRAVRKQAQYFPVMDLTADVAGEQEPYWTQQPMSVLKQSVHLPAEEASAVVSAWVDEMVPQAVASAKADPADPKNPQIELSATSTFKDYSVDVVATGGSDAVTRACEYVLAHGSIMFDKGALDLVTVTGIVDGKIVFVGLYDGQLESATRAYQAPGYDIFF